MTESTPASSGAGGHVPDDAPRLPQGLTLRPWREGDDLALLQTWGDPADPQQHQERTLLGPGSEGQDEREGSGAWSRCLVAEDDGVPVAAGAVRESTLHPGRLWFYAETAAPERRRGIGTVILEALRAEADVALTRGQVGTAALRTRFAVEHEGHVPTGSEGTQAFLAAQGFGEIQRSRRVVVGPGVLAPPELDGEHGMVLEETATGSVELTQAVVAFYQAVHDWDPAQMTVGRAQQHLLGPHTGASGAVVLRTRAKDQGGSIAAFALSYTPQRTEEPTDVLIGWDPELSAADAQFAAGSLLALLTATYPVQVELDDSMTALLPILDQLLSTGHAQVLMDTRIWATAPTSEDVALEDAEATGAAGPGADPGQDVPDPAELPDPLADAGLEEAESEGVESDRPDEDEPAQVPA